MAAVTERYVDARTDAVRAEHDAAIARPLVTLQASSPPSDVVDHRLDVRARSHCLGNRHRGAPITAAILKPVEGWRPGQLPSGSAVHGCGRGGVR